MAPVFEVIVPRLPDTLKGTATRRLVRSESVLAMGRISTVMKRAVVQETPTSSRATKAAWKRLPIKSRPNFIEGGVVNDHANRGQSVAEVLDLGTFKHPFPPVSGNEPALGPWIQRTGGWVRQVSGAGGTSETRPVDLTNAAQVKKLAFVIGRSIKRRGLPRDRSTLKRFVRAVQRVRGDINRAADRMLSRIATKLGF